MIINNKNSYKDRKYNIVSYDHSWPMQFTVYASKIKNIFGDDVQIEHIGSTSVLGMSGKPCIDILVILKDLRIVEDHIADMEKVGFEYSGQFVMENSRLFRVMNNNILLANVHFFPTGHPHNKEMIDLRNYLCINHDEIENYSKLKKELSIKYPNDYALYLKHKDEFMEALVSRVFDFYGN